MKLFDVYPLFDIEIKSGKGCYTYDTEGNEYLDLYGGHAVISIGHSHPYYINKITEQAQRLTFYSNSVKNSLQQQLSDKLGKISGYEDYSLFLINSGAEANENALKLASFHTGNKKVIAFSKAFHGRTSAAVKVTDNPKIVAPINDTFEVAFFFAQRHRTSEKRDFEGRCLRRYYRRHTRCRRNTSTRHTIFERT